MWPQRWNQFHFWQGSVPGPRLRLSPKVESESILLGNNACTLCLLTTLQDAMTYKEKTISRIKSTCNSISWSSLMHTDSYIVLVRYLQLALCSGSISEGIIWRHGSHPQFEYSMSQADFSIVDLTAEEQNTQHTPSTSDQHPSTSEIIDISSSSEDESETKNKAQLLRKIKLLRKVSYCRPSIYEYTSSINE